MSKISREIVHITASCDDNYAQHIGVSFQSLLSNTSEPERICLHLIADNISSANQDKLIKIADSFNSTIKIIPAVNDRYEGLPKARYGNAAYQRIALTTYLPDVVNKVIYIDSDTLVLNDIIKLWDIDLEDKGLAAVENFSPKACQDLNFKRTAYFNSGVLLINLNFWRTHQVFNNTIQLIKEHIDKIRYFDQCGLNLNFKDKWIKLPAHWNQQADIYGVLKKYSDGCGYSQEELKLAIFQPSIVHFIGTQKPWLINCYHPFKKTYQFYLAQTPWKAHKYNDDSFIQRIKHFFSPRKKFKQYKRAKEIKQNGNLNII